MLETLQGVLDEQVPNRGSTSTLSKSVRPLSLNTGPESFRTSVRNRNRWVGVEGHVHRNTGPRTIGRGRRIF